MESAKNDGTICFLYTMVHLNRVPLNGTICYGAQALRWHPLTASLDVANSTANFV